MGTDKTELAAKVKELESWVRDAKDTMAPIIGVSPNHPLVILARTLTDEVKVLRSKVEALEAEEEKWRGEAHLLAMEVNDRDRKIRSLEREADLLHDKITCKGTEAPVTAHDVLRHTSVSGRLMDLRRTAAAVRTSRDFSAPDASRLLLGLYGAMCALMELDPDVDGVVD